MFQCLLWPGSCLIETQPGTWIRNFFGSDWKSTYSAVSQLRSQHITHHVCFFSLVRHLHLTMSEGSLSSLDVHCSPNLRFMGNTYFHVLKCTLGDVPGCCISFYPLHRTSGLFSVCFSHQNKESGLCYRTIEALYPVSCNTVCLKWRHNAASAAFCFFCVEKKKAWMQIIFHLRPFFFLFFKLARWKLLKQYGGFWGERVSDEGFRDDLSALICSPH